MGETEVNSAIKKVRESEKKAAQLVSKAEKKRDKLVEDAKHHAMQIITDGQKECDERLDSSFKAFGEEIDDKKQQMHEQGMRTINTIERDSSKKVEATKKLILQKVEEMLK